MKPKRPRKDAYLGAQLEAELKQWIERVAAEQDVSTGKVVRDALREYRERHEKAA